MKKLSEQYFEYIRYTEHEIGEIFLEDIKTYGKICRLEEEKRTLENIGGHDELSNATTLLQRIKEINNELEAIAKREKINWTR